MNLTTANLLNLKIRLTLYTLSLFSLLFLQTYSSNVCQFIDGLQPNQVFRNLGFIFILHIFYREALYRKFKNPKQNLSLARHMYYLSMISWILAGFSALLLHFILYKDFPFGSHLKLLSSYVVIGAGVFSQLEYILFEKEYKKFSSHTINSEFQEKISQRFLEMFLVFTMAPLITLSLIIGRYSFEGLIDTHVTIEVLFMSSMLIISALLLAFTFKKSLKEDTKEIIQNIKNVKEQAYTQVKTINRPDELGEISYAIKEMSTSIYKSAQEISALNEEIINTQREIIYTMGEIAETRSKETGNHVKRVAEYSKLLALKLGLSQEEAELLKLASPMHDIGKVGIPDDILNKPGKHTPQEFEIMKTHAQLGFDMLKHSNKKILQAAAIVAGQHHEKYNGTGYPNQLNGENIHIYARITAVADVFDALGSDRVYKKAWDDEKIFQLFRDESAKHFDPKIVTVFFENLNDIFSIRAQYKEL